ncbi:hypothetical protein HZ326_4705 [Fusarium oxysporum f. sp. albedinis]|nr:hypothetical protein HZ326_4705 [Fusarium oxysporum f. sp. albedinis]
MVHVSFERSNYALHDHPTQTPARDELYRSNDPDMTERSCDSESRSRCSNHDAIPYKLQLATCMAQLILSP